MTAPTGTLEERYWPRMAMWQGHSISVGFPAYNEEEGIQDALRAFEALGIVDELLVVDNNSTDRTVERACETSARVVSEAAQGYGHALRRALAEARADYIVLCEPDGTFVARDLYKLLAYADDFDVVLGTRTTRELVWAEANMGWFLRAGNWAVAKQLQVLHNGPSLSDCGCTFRLLRRQARDRIQDRLTVGGSHFLVDFTIRALKEGLRVIEVPVNYRGRVGPSKITGTLSGALMTGLRMIRHILRERFSP